MRWLFRLKKYARAVLEAAAPASQAAVLAREALKDTKRTLKYVIRAKRKAKERAACFEIEQAMGNSKLFWAKWKARTRPSTAKPAGASVLDSDGNVVCDPLRTLQIWRDYTVELGKEVPLDGSSGFDDQFGRDVLAQLQASLTVGGTVPELTNPILWEEVHNAIRKLDAGKTPGPDGIDRELLRHAGIAFELVLTDLFNDVWTSLIWPTAWSVATLIPLYKDGDAQDPANHRLLSMMNELPKVLEKILDHRLRAWADRVGALSDLQGGFRAGRGTVDQMFILNEIVARRAEEQLPTFSCFVDIAKAYDTVWRPGLWAKLQATGCDSDTLSLLKAMYRNVVRRVLIQGRTSEDFVVEKGVPQGAVLSPLMYALYIDGLHDALRKHGCGVWVYGRLVPLLFDADDIVLLASSPEQLQASMRVLDQYARQWRFNVNHGKSNVLIFGPHTPDPQASWQLEGRSIKVTDQYKYLGLEFGAAPGRGKWNAYLRRMHAKASSGMLFMMYQGGGANGLSPRTMVHQWKSLCRPMLEYGCELWQGELSQKWCKRLESVQSAFGRATLGVKAFPASAAVRADLGLAPLESRRRCLKMLYDGKLCNAAHDRLLSLVFRRRHEEALAGGAKLSVLHSFKTELLGHQFGQAWRAAAVPAEWPQLVRDRVQEVAKDAETAVMLQHGSLKLFNTLGQDFTMGTHALLEDRSNILGTRLKSQLRFGVLWLMDRVAKVLDWPTAGGLCPRCRGGVEDAKHFLLECPFTLAHRTRLNATLDVSLRAVGVAGASLRDLFAAHLRNDHDAALRMLAGLVPHALCPLGMNQAAHDEQCGKAAWVFDKVTKNFLVRCWKDRRSVVGILKASHGVLTRTPVPVKAGQVNQAGQAAQDKTSQASWTGSGGDLFPAERRREWQRWSPCATPDPHVRAVLRGEPHGFYVVWRGRRRGVFYRWCDVFASVAGFSGARCKGFDGWHDAEEAFAEGAPD